MFDIKDYYTTDEAAEKLGYTIANITRLLRLGKIPAIKRGRRFMILKSDIDAYVMGAPESEEFLS